MAQTELALDIEMNILHIENNEALREKFTKLFTKKGYKVFSAASPIEAMQYFLTTLTFQLAIVDILFEDEIPNSISGDEFVFRCHNYLKDTKIIAHTGYEDQIDDKNRELFYNFIKKGKEIDLFQEVDNIFHLEVNAFIERGKNKDKNQNTEYLLAQEDLKRHQERLIQKLESIKNKYKPLVIFEDKEYSAVDLIKEIKENTEIGKLHIKIMLNFLDSQKSNGLN